MAALSFGRFSWPRLLSEIIDGGARAVDFAYGMAANNNRFTKPFFENGLGNLGMLSLTKDMAVLNPERPLPELQIQWTPIKEGKHEGWPYHLSQGIFDTPCEGSLWDALPPESRTARVQLLRPTGHSDPDLAIHLAGTGDHGYFHRLRLGYGLLKNGIASLVLESPYYGMRRPRLQVRSKLRQVSDLLLLGRVTIEESLCLLQWGRKIGYRRLCMAGLSMGGVHSVMTTCLSPHDVACAALLAPHSAVEPFCNGLLWLGTSQRWAPERHLSRQGEDWGGEGSAAMATTGKEEAREVARKRLAEALEITDTTSFPKPRRPDAAVFVAAASDLYVSTESVARVHRHWTGSELRIIPGGHVSAFVFQGKAFRQAIRDSINRL